MVLIILPVVDGCLNNLSLEKSFNSDCTESVRTYPNGVKTNCCRLETTLKDFGSVHLNSKTALHDSQFHFTLLFLQKCYETLQEAREQPRVWLLAIF